MGTVCYSDHKSLVQVAKEQNEESYLKNISLFLCFWHLTYDDKNGKRKITNIKKTNIEANLIRNQNTENFKLCDMWINKHKIDYTNSFHNLWDSSSFIELNCFL